MIRIVKGVYGFLDKDGIVRPKTEADAPFTLLPEQEERLVRLGVAQYVGNVKEAQEPADLAESEAFDSDDITVDEIPLSTYSVKELRDLGKEYGLTFKVGMSKTEMVAAIEEAEAELNAGEDDGEEAPVFDASEAVQ